MKVTKTELHNALINARVSLNLGIGTRFRNRHGFCASLIRNEIREKIAAYRLLANVSMIDAELYTHDKRELARIKKALAK